MCEGEEGRWERVYEGVKEMKQMRIFRESIDENKLGSDNYCIG